MNKYREGVAQNICACQLLGTKNILAFGQPPTNSVPAIAPENVENCLEEVLLMGTLNMANTWFVFVVIIIFMICFATVMPSLASIVIIKTDFLNVFPFWDGDRLSRW